LSQPDTLAGLGRVVYPEYSPPKNKDTFATNANAYKSCADNGSNLTFLYPGAVANFDDRVKNGYPKALKAMREFTDQFLEVGTSLKKEEWLVKALLDILENDGSIAEEQEFFICSGGPGAGCGTGAGASGSAGCGPGAGASGSAGCGKGITKATIRHMTDFSLQPLLLGVWHFVVVNRPDNKSGKATFDSWCPPRGRAERKYEGNIGIGIKRKVNVEVLSAPSYEENIGIGIKRKVNAEVLSAPSYEENTGIGIKRKVNAEVLSAPSEEGNTGIGIKRKVNAEVLSAPSEEATAEEEAATAEGEAAAAECEAAAAVEPVAAETAPPVLDADPKRITVNNYGTVQNQKFIPIETMNGDIHL
jgi:hypothetical protein